MQSAIVKRSIVIAGHKTSVSMENAFWNALKEIGRSHEMALSTLVTGIDTSRQNGNLSSAIRLFVLDHFRTQTGGISQGPAEAGTDMPSAPQDRRQSQPLNGRAIEVA